MIEVTVALIHNDIRWGKLNKIMELPFCSMDNKMLNLGEEDVDGIYWLRAVVILLLCVNKHTWTSKKFWLLSFRILCLAGPFSCI